MGGAFAASYLTWERARGFVVGTRDAAPSALGHLAFAHAHMGFHCPDLGSDLVKAAGISSVADAAEAEERATVHTGTLPLLHIALCEDAANLFRSDPASASSQFGISAPSAAWLGSRLIAFQFGLRPKELRSARIEDEHDIRLVHISFHPKGN